MDLAEKLEEMITTQVKQAMKQGGGSGISGRRKSDDPRRTDVELASKG